MLSNRPSPPERIDTAYWQKLDDSRVRCTLCPKFCTLRDGKRGACFIRRAHHGRIELTSYGRSSGFCIDPIEKKPLNHFFPGSSILSLGTAGCNLGCKFCQNWHISKSRQMDALGQTAWPDQIASAARQHGCDSVAFTYNDPVIFIEYARDIIHACQLEGIKTVMVSAGYINPKPREHLFAHVDAANIDLKGFTESFYKKYCLGSLQPVLETLEYLHTETQVWLEVTTLLIPEANDSDKELHALCQWYAEKLGPDVPLHFSAFHPDFKLSDRPPTPIATLKRASQIAKQYGLHYVYLGNVHDAQGDTTYCPHCHAALIKRDWYQILQNSLGSSGRCPHCHTKIAGHFAKRSHNFGSKRQMIKIE